MSADVATPSPGPRGGLPPGPRLPYALQTILVWRFTLPFLRWCRRRYGPTFAVRAVIGVEDPERLARLRVALRRIVRFSPTVELMWVWPRLGAVGPWRRQLRWQAEAEALLSDEIARRRAAADLEDRTDILSMLV